MSPRITSPLVTIWSDEWTGTGVSRKHSILVSHVVATTTNQPHGATPLHSSANRSSRRQPRLSVGANEHGWSPSLCPDPLTLLCVRRIPGTTRHGAIHVDTNTPTFHVVWCGGVVPCSMPTHNVSAPNTFTPLLPVSHTTLTTRLWVIMRQKGTVF